MKEGWEIEVITMDHSTNILVLTLFNIFECTHVLKGLDFGDWQISSFTYSATSKDLVVSLYKPHIEPRTIELEAGEIAGFYCTDIKVCENQKETQLKILNEKDLVK